MSEKSRTNVKILRFKNGDTIICSLSVDNNFQEYCYLLESPMQINMLPVVSKKGIQSMTIFMQEWMEYSKDKHFKIPKDVIMLIANPEDEMIDEYFDALEKNELHRIQRDFEDISKNYGKNNHDKHTDMEYNSDIMDYEDEDDEYYDEDEEGKPEDSD